MTSGGFWARLLRRAPAQDARTPLEVAQELGLEAHFAIGFGYKTGWIAIRSDKVGDVVQALQPKVATVVPWRDGLAATQRKTGAIEQVYVTPVHEGFVCVVLGLQGAMDTTASVEAMKDMLARLSDRFGWAGYFGSYRVVDYVAWAFAEAGQVTRVFAWVGGETPILEGAPGPAE